MECRDKNCQGEIAFGQQAILKISDGPHSHEPFYPCDVCGLLHDIEGYAVEHVEKGRAYKKGNEVIFIK
ncbi:MAG: hypothetical protein WC523_07445 [Patescibacteria group bacterium]|jgi:hypothetical protein